MRLAGREVQRYQLLEAVDQIVGLDAAIELRVAEVAAALRDQVLQLPGQQAPDLQAHTGQVAHQHGQFLLARKREQGAPAHDRQLGREGRQQQHALALRAQLVAARRLQALGDAHQQIASALGLRQLEAHGRRDLALAGDGAQGDPARALEHRVVDGLGVGRPVEPLFAAVCVLAGGGQLPGLDRAGHLALVDRHGGGGMQHVFGLAVLAGDDGRLQVGDRQAVKPGNVDGAHKSPLRARPATLGGGARGQLQRHGPGLLRNGQRLRLHGGGQLVFVIAHGVLQALAIALLQQRAFAAGLAVGQLQALLELRRVHGMRKAQLKQRAAHIGLGRVLVELGAGDACGEDWCEEFELHPVHLDLFGQRIAGQPRHVLLSHGPIVPGHELQLPRSRPAPAAGESRLQAHALRRLADEMDGRGVAREGDAHGVWPGFLFHGGARRRGDAGLEPQRLGPLGYQAMPPLHQRRLEMPAQRQQYGEHHHQHQALLQPAQRAAQAAQHESQPGRRLPGADQQAQQRGQRHPQQG